MWSIYNSHIKNYSGHNGLYKFDKDFNASKQDI